MEAFAPYLFVIIIAIPAVLLIAQVSGSLGRGRVESERERVRRQQHENNLRRSNSLRHREQPIDAPKNQNGEFTPNLIAEAFDKFKSRPPRPYGEARRR